MMKIDRKTLSAVKGLSVLRFRYAGLAILAVFAIAGIFAPWLAPYEPFERVGTPFARPSAEHLLGCNDVGYDLFTELIYGGRISLFIGLFASFFATGLATALALLSGYYGGLLDRIIMRLVDVVMSLPFLPLVIVLGVFLKPGIHTQIIVITTVMWAHPCRELRSQVLKIRESGFIDSARAMGDRSASIIFRHVLPELMPLIVPQFVRVVQTAIMIESSLSFLGLGDPVLKSWGSILFFANTRAAFLTGAWVNWVLPPGFCIALTVLAFSLIGFSLGGKVGLSYFSFGSFLLSRKEKPAAVPDKGKRLSIRNLSVIYQSSSEVFQAVNHTGFEVAEGEILGLVGESGCGKSTIAMSILGLLRFPAKIASGAVFFNGKDLLELPQDQLFRIRGKNIAYIPQNAMNALNPVVSIKKQIIEAIQIHQDLSRQEAEERVLEILSLVEIPPERINAYSHELSGGMKQRVVIAMALVNNPEFLIADEPTTGLDVLVQQEIMRLLLRLRDKLNLSILFITHDLPLVMDYADSMAVMYQGEIVDTGPVDKICASPSHPHTIDLLENFPRLNAEKKWKRDVPPAAQQPALKIQNITKSFGGRRRLFLPVSAKVHAVNNFSLSIMPGEVVGLIGGSGSGKTTVARMIMDLEKPDSGTIHINGEQIAGGNAYSKQQILKNIHLVFQDPYQSIRNHMRILDVLAEPLIIHKIQDKEEIHRRAVMALDKVNLPSDGAFLKRFPSELSGGQRQRLSFARAIITGPKLIIADEPTSMLDVSLRTGLLDLMERLRFSDGVGFLFITHDLALARHFCDRIVVLKEGCVVEEGFSDQIIQNPAHEYTRNLIQAAREPKLLGRDTGY